MTRSLWSVGLGCGLLLMLCCGKGGESETQTKAEMTGTSGAANAGTKADPSACGEKVCKAGFFALGFDAGVTCCVDATEGQCGVQDRTGACKATKLDSRCPDFTTSVGPYKGCCTEDNMCGLYSNGLSGYGCLSLSEPILRENEKNVPEPRACASR
jgi:hypothetical protein